MGNRLFAYLALVGMAVGGGSVGTAHAYDVGSEVSKVFNGSLNAAVKNRQDEQRTQQVAPEIRTLKETEKYGVWVTFDYAKVNYDDNDAGENSTRVLAGLAGGDVKVTDSLTLGMLVGYGDSETRDDDAAGKYKLDTKTKAIGGYGSYFFLKHFFADGTVALATTDWDEKLTSGTTGSDDTTSIYMTGGLNAVTNVKEWDFLGRVGYTWLHIKDASYTDSAGTNYAEDLTVFGMLDISGEVGYTYKKFRPSVSAVYSNMVMTNDFGEDPVHWLVGAGIDWYAKDNLTVSLKFDKMLGRKNIDAHNVYANVRYNF